MKAYTAQARCSKKGQINRAHNRRDPEAVARANAQDIAMGIAPHIDPSKPHKALYDLSVDEVLHSLWDKQIEAYNARQKPCRRKDFDHWKREAKRQTNDQIEREIIMTVGSFKNGYPDDTERIMARAIQLFHASFPQMKITGIYLHQDEPTAAPHIHITYIPTYTRGEKGRGLETHIGMRGALEEAGFTNAGWTTPQERENGAMAQFDKALDEIMTKALEEFGYTRKRPPKKEDKLDTRLYKVKEAVETAEITLQSAVDAGNAQKASNARLKAQAGLIMEEANKQAAALITDAQNRGALIMEEAHKERDKAFDEVMQAYQAHGTLEKQNKALEVTKRALETSLTSLKEKEKITQEAVNQSNAYAYDFIIRNGLLSDYQAHKEREIAARMPHKEKEVENIESDKGEER